LLALNLPLVGVMVNLLRIPYAYLYPMILVFCILGVYAINQSVVEVWIMIVSGALGYVLRKFDFDVAPVVLGVVLSPMIETALRQSLAMSSGDWGIFFVRPLAAGMIGLAAALSLLSIASAFMGKSAWRRAAGLET